MQARTDRDLHFKRAGAEGLLDLALDGGQQVPELIGLGLRLHDEMQAALAADEDLPGTVKGHAQAAPRAKARDELRDLARGLQLLLELPQPARGGAQALRSCGREVACGPPQRGSGAFLAVHEKVSVEFVRKKRAAEAASLKYRRSRGAGRGVENRSARRLEERGLCDNPLFFPCSAGSECLAAREARFK